MPLYRQEKRLINVDNDFRIYPEAKMRLNFFQAVKLISLLSFLRTGA